MDGTQVTLLRANEKPNWVSFKVGADLYDLILSESQSRGIPLIDVVVQAVAAHYGKPELGYVPRNTRGPKPGKNRSPNGNGHKRKVAV